MTAPKLRTLRAIPPTIGIDPGSGRTGTSGTGRVAVVGVELARATLVREPHHELATSLRRCFLRAVGLVDAWSRELRPDASCDIAFAAHRQRHWLAQRA